MRKGFIKCAAAVLLAGMMCGCKDGNIPFTGSKKTDFDTGYSVTADITCGKLSATADVTRNSTNDWLFCFTEPKELMGLTLCLDDAGMTVKLGALSVSADISQEYSALPEIIAKAVDKLPELTEDNMTEKDGVLTAETDFNGQRVIITAAKDTGELISLKCPYYKLAVHFSGQSPEAATEEIVLIEE